jgi:exoribonuclease R
MSKKFEEYVAPDAADEGIKSGRFAAGVLRVNPKRPSDGFCVTGKDDILIKGKLDRNRAFNGDSIVVEIYPECDWHRTTSEEEQEGGVDSTKVGGLLSVSVPDADRDELLLESGTSTKVSPSTSLFNGRGLAQVQPAPGIIKTGRVVYVSNAIWKSRVYACCLEPNRNASSDPLDLAGVVGPEDKLIRAVPVDKRIPWILIQVNDVLMKILNLPGKLDPAVLYPIQVMKWQTNGALPLGRIKGVAYGKVGEPEVEAKVCLAEAGLQDHEIDFPKSVHDEVEQMQANFHDEVKSESKSRVDLRHKRVFTIDPATARDLDDAIHVDIINREFIEVGVHIADVSHYVKENSKVRIHDDCVFYYDEITLKTQ